MTTEGEGKPEIVPEIYKFTGNRSLLEWMLCEALTKEAADSLSAAELKVALVVNGIQCPLEPTFKVMEEEFQNMVNKAAGELVLDKMTELQNLISRMKEEVERRLIDAGMLDGNG